jgi:PAS domain S-box-containing protein
MDVAVQQRGRRRWARRAGRSAPDRLSGLVADLEVPACVVDAQGFVVAANSSLKTLLGFENDDLAGRPLSAAADSYFQRDAMGALFQAQSDRHQVTARSVHRITSEALWTRWDFSLIRDAKGRPEVALGLVEDLTGRIHADSHVRILQYLIAAAGRARDTEELLRAAVQVICHFTGCDLGQIWIPDGDVLVCSPLHYSHGYALEGVRRASQGATQRAGEGLPGAAWISDEAAVSERVDDDMASDRAAPLWRAGVLEVVAVPIKTVSGVVAVFELFVTSDRAAFDRISLISKVAIELGQLLERRTLNDALRLSEERFRSVADSAVDAIVSADSDGCVLTWNRGAEQMFGWKAEEVAGRHLTVIIPERFRSAHVAGLARVAASGNSKLAGTVVELSAVHRDGHEFPIELSIGMWEAHGARGFSGVIRDISERKQAQDAVAHAAREVERTNAELETLIYTASHDLKSPMVSVLGYLDYLKVDYGEQLGDEGGRYLQRMTDCTLYMQRLISDLMELSRVGRLEANIVDLDLQSLAETLVDEIGAGHPDVTFHVRGLPVISADPLAFRQLLTNLVENAVVHGKRRDLTVLISSRVLADQSVELLVRDNGQGIPPQYRELVFGVFERLDGASGGPRSGTGMGLAICKKITEQFGGQISIAGTSGTEVRVLLPAGMIRHLHPAAISPAATVVDVLAGTTNGKEVPA